MTPACCFEQILYRKLIIFPAAKNYGRTVLMPGHFLCVLCVVFLRVLCGFIILSLSKDYHRAHKVPIAIGITQRAQRFFGCCCEELLELSAVRDRCASIIHFIRSFLS